MKQSKLSLLTTTRFDNDLHAVGYELMLATLLMNLSVSAKQDAVNSDDDHDAAKLFHHQSATDRIAAKKVRDRALHYLSTLYGVEYSAITLIDEQAAIATREFLKLTQSIASMSIANSRREGLSDEQAMDRVAKTKLRSK